MCAWLLSKHLLFMAKVHNLALVYWDNHYSKINCEMFKVEEMEI